MHSTTLCIFQVACGYSSTATVTDDFSAGCLQKSSEHLNILKANQHHDLCFKKSVLCFGGYILPPSFSYNTKITMLAWCTIIPAESM